MASNDVQKIYDSLASVEQKLSKLSKDNAFLKRISKLEKDVKRIERYINALDNTGKQINSIVKKFIKLFSFLR